MNLNSNSEDRRSFIKKSLATAIAASQPLFLAGLIRASAGGAAAATTVGPGTTEEPTPPGKVTTDPYTTFPDTTVDPDPIPAPVPEDTTLDSTDEYTYV